MKLVDKVNMFIHPLMIKRVVNTYNKKVNAIFEKRPELNKGVSKETTEKHLALYRELGIPYDDRWLRLYSNLSGIEDYQYVPESIYASVIERVMNECECANHEYEDKNIFEKLIDKKYLPDTILRYVRGCFFDKNFNFVSRDVAKQILSIDHGTIIGKQSTDSSGGKSVIAYNFHSGKYISDDNITLSVEWIEQTQMHYIMQKALTQCEFTKQFNPTSVNTCRMITMRCPWDGKVVLLKSFLRMGIAKTAVDNMSSGGICVGINKAGELDAYAYTYIDRMRLNEHPESKISFKGLKHPFFQLMTDVVIEESKKIPNFNIISWDVIADQYGQVKIIEANLISQNPDIAQLAFGSLFGEYTEQLIDWVSQHMKNDSFKHVRTF